MNFSMIVKSFARLCKRFAIATTDGRNEFGGLYPTHLSRSTMSALDGGLRGTTAVRFADRVNRRIRAMRR
jgi:hypothetical protein